MASIDTLQAAPGEPILPKWQNLIRWIRRQQVQAPGARVTYGEGGAQVLFTPEEYGQVVRFRVTLAGDINPKITVGDGTINGILPKVRGIPITGQENPPLPPPEINIVSPNNEGIVLACIKTTHDQTGKLTEATIETKQPADLPGGMRADFAVGQHGFIPIALIRHDLQSRQPVSVYQHSVHNLQCRMYDGGQGKRVIYWAA